MRPTQQFPRQVGALEAMVTAMTSHADEAKVQIWASCNWAREI